MRGQILHPRSLGHPAKRVAEADHHRQRHDNGRHLDARRQPAIDRAQQRATRAGDHDDDRDRQLQLRERSRGNAAHRERRPNGDIDLAGHDQERHAERDDQHRQVREKEISEISGCEKIRRDQAEPRRSPEAFASSERDRTHGIPRLPCSRFWSHRQSPSVPQKCCATPISSYVMRR